VSVYAHLHVLLPLGVAGLTRLGLILRKLPPRAQRVRGPVQLMGNGRPLKERQKTGELYDMKD